MGDTLSVSPPDTNDVVRPSTDGDATLAGDRTAETTAEFSWTGRHMDPSKKHALDIKGAGREASMSDFNTFVRDAAGYQVMAIQRPLEPETVARVICVRHGMGHHNDAFQTASFMNRDAELNRVGITQAAEVGDILRRAGVFELDRLLVVISPMCRTLQTALVLFGGEGWERAEWAHTTVIQPLAAETSVASRLPGPRLARKVVANVQQGGCALVSGGCDGAPAVAVAVLVLVAVSVAVAVAVLVAVAVAVAGMAGMAGVAGVAVMVMVIMVVGHMAELQPGVVEIPTRWLYGAHCSQLFTRFTLFTAVSRVVLSAR